LKLDIHNAHFSYGDKEILKGVSLSAEKGLTSFIGPNAAGKSTLLKCVAGILRPSEGDIRLGEFDLINGMNDEAKRQMSYMPQEPPYRTSLTVMEVMLLGRLNELKWKVGKEDIEIAYNALEELGIEDLARRPMYQLSGGQSQIVMVAQCIMRSPKLLMMDEPINNLDLQKQLEMFDILGNVTEKNGLTTVMVLHDINLAARFSEKIVILSQGSIYNMGKPKDVITEDMLRDVYGVESRVTEDVDGIIRVDPLYSVRFGKRNSKTTMERTPIEEML